ncbi:hypothetical protein [Neobacillus sp. SuZ13]|uniref:hypothetical protein n=1 Tax=Neobacillus sp. SuZ13 TaxID=3047875 RepID=UPI0024BFD72E|nr:hypothetical protein [Neobacillus sp. SuZ13]WHY67817.1 hypothetical protein QNH17_03975 [Neobacillus sp. SuZ13]
MKIFIYVSLFLIIVYTMGFGVSMWKEKQKMGALAIFFLSLCLIILPFFSIL